MVGITGSLATGKSTVSAMFAERGAGVINADLLAHRGMRPGGACYKKILKAFGAGILNKGRIDRRKLAEVVFNSRPKLKKLEGIVHPFVIKEARAHARSFAKAGKNVIVLDVPLLFESGMDKLTDLTVTVRTSGAVQLARIKRQGRLSAQEAKRRIKAQFSLNEKVRRSDLVIDNNGPLHRTREQVKQIWNMLQRRYS